MDEQTRQATTTNGTCNRIDVRVHEAGHIILDFVLTTGAGPSEFAVAMPPDTAEEIARNLRRAIRQRDTLVRRMKLDRERQTREAREAPEGTGVPELAP